LPLGFNRWAYRAKRRTFRRMVRSWFGSAPPGRVLDVGSGTGFYVEQWRALGARSITATDLTGAALASLRERFPEIEVARLDIGEVLESDRSGTVDAVSAMDVLYHIVDDARYRRAFANMFALLKPGGLLVFSDFLASTRKDKRHVVARTRAETEDAARGAGFELRRRAPWLVLMNSPLKSRSRSHTRFFERLTTELRAHPRLGGAAGAALYPAEIVLSRLVRRAPSLEIVLCRKPD